MTGTINRLRCPDCQDKELERTEEIHICECGCETHFKGQALCAAHAFTRKCCKVCGESLDKDGERDRTPAEKKAERERRRRILRSAVIEKDKVRDIETARRRRTRKECGKLPPVRQRHRAMH